MIAFLKVGTVAGLVGSIGVRSASVYSSGKKVHIFGLIPSGEHPAKNQPVTLKEYNRLSQGTEEKWG